MSRSYSAALPIAYVVLQILIVLNWLVGLAILLVLFVMPHERWIMTELGLTPGPAVARVVMGLRAIALIGLAAVPLHYAILKRLLAMVDTVRAGDPFVPRNAERLRTIAWVLLALQLLSMIIGSIAEGISTRENPLHLNAAFSVSGWLAVLLTFLLAQVFAEGTMMREDLEGTI